MDEIVSAKRARDQLAVGHRLLLDRLCALHALPCGRAIDSRSCLSDWTEHVVMFHTPDHHRTVHVFGFRMDCGDRCRAKLVAAVACAIWARSRRSRLWGRTLQCRPVFTGGLAVVSYPCPSRPPARLQE